MKTGGFSKLNNLITEEGPRRFEKTETPEFKRWFGKSKVVDSEGKPLPVYRGEHGEEDLKTRLASYSFGSPETASTYAMQPNDRVKDKEAKNPRVMKVYLRIENPFIESDDPFIDFSQIGKAFNKQECEALALKFADAIMHTNNWEERSEELGVDTVEEFIEAGGDLENLYFDAYRFFNDFEVVDKLKSLGFDGAIHEGNGESSMELEYKVFSLNQVKSVFNRGTFDSSNNIMESLRRLLEEGDEYKPALRFEDAYVIHPDSSLENIGYTLHAEWERGRPEQETQDYGKVRVFGQRRFDDPNKEVVISLPRPANRFWRGVKQWAGQALDNFPDHRKTPVSLHSGQNMVETTVSELLTDNSLLRFLR
jgi:hypothetical protein